MTQGLTEPQVVTLLQPYLEGCSLPATFCADIVTYLELLLRWNARTNLTAVRHPEMLVQRQVGESLVALRFMLPGASLLDFGSGAGFPGIPLQLACPAASVTLAESQGKKASFLREAVRVLGLGSAVWAGRAEDLPAGEQFDIVTMRAVDNSERMAGLATDRISPGGCLLRYTGNDSVAELPGWHTVEAVEIPLSSGRLLRQVRV